MTAGAPTPGAAPIPGTPSGLLEAKYDSYTGEVSFNPSERAEVLVPTTPMKRTRPPTRPLAELRRQLGADLNGLTSAEAASRLQRYGADGLESQRGFSLLRKILSRFRNPLVLILLAAGAVSGLTGEIASFVIIATMVVISVALDIVQEYRADQAAESSAIAVRVQATVIRDGARITRFPSPEWCAATSSCLAAGDLVPADGRVLEAKDLFVNQSLLTGESVSG